MNYNDKITLVALNDSLLQNLKSHNQTKNDIVVYRVAEKLNAKGYMDYGFIIDTNYQERTIIRNNQLININ